MKRLAAAGLLIAAALAGTAAVALAAPATITGDGADTFVGEPDYPHEAGTVAQLVVTGSQHNVTSTAGGPDGKALFRSSTVSGGSTPVGGTEFLAPGRYPFVCTIHVSTMSGDLVVGAGTPLARPTVAVKVLDRKLAKVVESGRLRIRATTTGSGESSFGAFIGKKRIVAGSSATGAIARTIKLRVTAKGQAKLEQLGRAKVRVTGAVDFGSPVSVVAKLK